VFAKISGKRLFGRWLGLPATASIAVSMACSAPGKGALILAISTDMQAPKDISTVSLFITEGQVVKFDYVGLVAPDGSVSLPSTLALVEPDDPSTQIQIRVIGFNGQTARVLRDVQTTVPHQRTALMRVPLDFIDLGSATGMIPGNYYPSTADAVNVGVGDGGAGGGGIDVPEGTSTFDPDQYITSTCDKSQLCEMRGMPGVTCNTMINGICQNALVDSTTLPDYSDALVFGTGGNNPLNENCFNAGMCFEGATPVANVTFNANAMNACTFPLPADLGESNSNPNGGLESTDGGEKADGAAVATDGSTAPNDASELSGGGSSSGSSGTSQTGTPCGATSCTQPEVCCVLETKDLAECVASSQQCALLQQQLGGAGDSGAVAAMDAAAAPILDGGFAQSLIVTLSAAIDAGASSSSPGSDNATFDAGAASGGGSGSGSDTTTSGSSGGSSTGSSGNSSTGSSGNSSTGPSGTGSSANLNFALVTSNGVGACNAQGLCFVPIESDPVEGWVLSGNTVTLAPGLCSMLMANTAQLYAVNNASCPTKVESQPVCGLVQELGDGGVANGDDGGVAEDGGIASSGGGVRMADAAVMTSSGGSSSGSGSSGGGFEGDAQTFTPPLDAGTGTGFGAPDATVPDAGTTSVLTGVTSLAAGVDTTCAVIQDDTVDCWGVVLGVQMPTPTNVPGLDGVSVGAVGGNLTAGFACALESGSVLCEGQNGSGQLGNGSQTPSDTPVLVSGLGGQATAVTAGAAFTCALVSGTVECWGDNTYGQLGNGTAVSQSLEPVAVSNLTNATAIAAGSDFACAVVAGTSVECWGDNTYGILGPDADGGPSSNEPVAVTGFIDTGTISSITAGMNHVCALFASGSLECWGDNSFDQLGTGGASVTGSSSSPVEAFGGTASQVAAGGNETCVVVQKEVACWGANDQGQLGSNPSSPSSSPVLAISLGTTATAVVVGAEHACALVQGGSVECWGSNSNGQLGRGSSSATPETPAPVVAAGASSAEVPDASLPP